MASAQALSTPPSAAIRATKPSCRVIGGCGRRSPASRGRRATPASSAASAAGEQPDQVERRRSRPVARRVVLALDRVEQHAQFAACSSCLARSASASRRTSSRTPWRNSSSRYTPRRALHLQQVVGADGLEEVPGAGVAGELDRPARRRWPSCTIRLERLHRLAADVVEVHVGRVLGGDQDDLDRLGHGEEAGGADRFEPDARVLVGGQLLEQSSASGTRSRQ